MNKIKDLYIDIAYKKSFSIIQANKNEEKYLGLAQLPKI